MLPSEEDLRGRLMTPYLAAIGVGPDRLRFEQAFTLRLGHHVAVKNKPNDPKYVRGRLDILVQNDAGEPLFVLELKRESEALTEDDRDQGISYARLMTPIAPFVVLTNGRDTRIYDTYTAQELAPDAVANRYDDFQAGRFYPSGEDIRLRHEALQHFVSYSEENLRLFLEAQRSARMRALRGEEGTWEKKYIRELYTARAGVDHAVSEFLTSESPVFVLAGPSGVGKSNEACALAERLSRDHFVLFLNGTELAGSPGDAIAEEFNWHFGEQLPAVRICERVTSIAGRFGTERRFVVIIDAVDEAASQDMPRALSSFVGHLAAFGGRLKLLVSLKTSDWPRFARLGGNVSPLAASMFPPSMSGNGADVGSRRQEKVEGSSQDSTAPSPSFTIASFSNVERDEAVGRYSVAFGLAGQFSADLLQAVADPFLLRIVAEAYAGRGSELPADPGEMSLLARYVQRKLEKLDDPSARQVALREMSAVAIAQLRDHADDTGIHGGNEGVGNAGFGRPAAEDQVRGVLELRTGESMSRHAIATGLLFDVEDEYGRRRIGFQYDRVRDFVLVTHVLRLDQLSADEFIRTFDEFSHNRISFAALRTYLRDPKPAHRTAFNSYVTGRMQRLVDTYERLYAELSPSLREHVAPFTRTGSVGLVYTLYPNGWFSAGLFVRASSERQIINHPDYSYEFWAAYDQHRDAEPSAQVVRGGRDWTIVRSDPAYIAAEWLLDGLRETAEKGGLDDSGSYVLAVEKVLAITSRHRDELGLQRQPAGEHWTRASITPLDLIPLDVDDLRRRVHAVFGAEHYKEEYARKVTARVSAESLVRGESPEFISYSLDRDAISEAVRRGRAEAMRGRRFPAPRRHGGFDLGVLASALDVVAEHRRVIDEHYLPGPDQIPLLQFKHFEAAYSDEQLVRLIRALFDYLLTEYERVARTSLGRLAGALRLIQKLPVDVVVQYWPPALDELVSDSQRGGAADYILVPASDEAVREVEVHIAPGDTILPKWLQGGDRVMTARGERQVLGWTSTRFMSLVQPSHDVPIEYRGSRSATFLTPVRSWVHRKITAELKDLSSIDLLRALGVSEETRELVNEQQRSRTGSG